MPPNYRGKWWGWGRSDESFPLSIPSAFWHYLETKIGPLGNSPPIDSLDAVALTPSRLTDREEKILANAVGSENVSTHPHDRAVHSLGKSYCDLIRIRRGTIPQPTDVVVYPGTESEVAAVLKLARVEAWALIPFGGGTSVVGGVEPTAGARPVITIDLCRLNRILHIDKESRLATVQCGILGPQLESELNEAGYTLGHFPQSFVFSTMGGWIATRSAGQYSTKYGKIEDLVSSLRVITPAGTIETPQVPAAAAGSDLLQILIGSEGAYGIVTQATVRLQPLAPFRRFPSYLFHSFDEGVTTVRKLLHLGLRPTILRLSRFNSCCAAIPAKSKW